MKCGITTKSFLLYLSSTLLSTFFLFSTDMKPTVNPESSQPKVKYHPKGFIPLEIEDEFLEDTSPTTNLDPDECSVYSTFLDMQLENPRYTGAILKEAMESPHGIKCKDVSKVVRSSSAYCTGHVCLICKYDIGEYAQVLFMLECGHYCHTTCVDTHNLKCCPLCQRSVQQPNRLYTKMTLHLVRQMFNIVDKQGFVENALYEKKFVDSLSDTEFYALLKMVVFQRKLPVLWNITRRRKSVFESPCMFYQNDVEITLYPSDKMCRREQLCDIGLFLYKHSNDVDLEYVHYALTQFKELLMYLE